MTSLIPTHAASHITDGLSEYLTTSFSLADKSTADQLRDFLLNPHGGMFYGPYVRTRLPYAPATDWEGVLSWMPDWFKPYRHQAEAFRRLRSTDENGPRRPQPTMVVTGTGSGKTESFLYPILDHCRRSQARGIKAVILYPMNALASDQEQRLAKLLTDDPALAGITAGLYTGEVSTGGRTKVSQRGLITNRQVMQDSPPDILLTNYKMLDQLLLRENDRALWKSSAHSLQYLVLDEFHTYDAAQGTDVAMLLRRLGLMLKQRQDEGFLSPEEQARPLGRVTPVATSATLGGGPDSDGTQEILNFAYTVFGEEMTSDAIVGETLLSIAQWQDTIPELLGRQLPNPTQVPDVGAIRQIVDKLSAAVANGEDYAAAVHRIVCTDVFGCAVDVDSAIAAMATNQAVARILHGAAQARPLEHSAVSPGNKPDVEPLVNVLFPEPADRRKLGTGAAEFTAIILSEIAYLRAQFGARRDWEGKKIPGVETHLWVREISRIDRAVGAVNEESVFRWSDSGITSDNSVADSAARRWLPAIYCRHCGRSGWMTAVLPGDDQIEAAVQAIRHTSIKDRGRTRPLIDATAEEAAGVLRSIDGASKVRWLNMDLPALQDSAPDDEQRETAAIMPVLTYTGEDVEERAQAEQCPSCGENDAIRYLGASLATLLSVALSNLFGMDDLDNSEKKTLVFADSVQDAAHRAGFIQNRARAFALRARINRAARELMGDELQPVPLSDLAQKMIDHAQEEASPAERSRALYELLPPDLTHTAKFRGAWEPGIPAREHAKAMSALSHRLDLDLALQFGDRVDLPRSLVSTGTLSVAVDVDDDVLLEAARETGVMGTDHELVAWARGVVEKMRIEGGINHPWFKGYLTDDCNPYMLNRRVSRAKGVPAFPLGGTPSFPRAGATLKGAKGKRNNNATMSLGSPRGWYARWTTQQLGIAGTAFSGATLVTELFNQLEMAGVVGSVPTKSSGRVYFLDPRRVIVGHEPAAELLECDVCRVRIGTDARGRTALLGSSCFSLDCEGHFGLTPVHANYYDKLYSSHNTRTVVAHEHTGLLESTTRKKVEEQFKAPADEQQADSPNVLVATPTLEMGIDIGDLSTVMLASMPPHVANYVQRVGRAGRLTGNSLIVALARGRGRALTKLEHPLETVAGSVTAPAAYLSAREIMHRQFIAYLFDTHSFGSEVEEITTANSVFTDFSRTALDALIDLVRKGIGTELDAFCSVLEAHTSADVLAELRDWAQRENGLIGDVEFARTRWQASDRELKRRLGVLQVREQELAARVDASPADDEDINDQHRTTVASRKFTQRALHSHRDEHWVAALERYGLLPNFTLLDDTVEFRVSVTSYNEEIQGFETESFDYSRGISSALTELAPGNTFYVEGVAAEIDTVDLGAENSALVQWRLCPECSYAEETAPGATTGPCPTCGAAGFADQGQLIDVVEMTRVSATVDRSRSTITDFDDDRRSQRYQTQLTFSVPENTRGTQWYLSGSGFGMAHLPQVNMKWLNLGRIGGGAQKYLGGREVEAPLFRVCERCGHLDSEAGSNSWKDHHPWCDYRNAMDEHSITFGLGRRLTTQGVLVTVPAALSVMESTTLPSLLAAIKLGFKEYLGGNPDHLDIEPVRSVSDGAVADALLIHDRIPGGTGYLAQFTKPDQVREMFKVAYERLLNCTCAEEERESCPACLLPYAPASQIPSISRAAAAAALAKILADNLHLEPDADPLDSTWEGNITETAPERTEQSKLEQRAIEQLRADLKDAGATVHEGMSGNYARWDISFPSSPHKWVMTEQMTIGGTRPDFVFETPDPQIRNIAVYLDGYAFHAMGKNQRLADDFHKRNTLFDEGYLPWSITWADIEWRQQLVKNLPTEQPAWHKPAIEEFLATQLTLSTEKLANLRRDPLTLLLEILKTPHDSWGKLSLAAFLEAVNGGQPQGNSLVQTYFTDVTVRFSTDKSVAVSIDIDDDTIDHETWRTFLGLTNYAYLEPARSTVAVLTRGAKQVEVAEAVVDKPEAESTNPLWAEVLKEYAEDDDILPGLHALIDAGSPAPDSDLLGKEFSDVPVITGWSDRKVLLAFPGDADSMASTGYTIFDCDFTSDTIPSELAQRLGINAKGL